MSTQDPTTDYAKALALFSKMPGPKPFNLIDPATDFRNRMNPNVKSGMVSSTVDVTPQPKQWSTNPFLGLVHDNQAKTQDELARQQRRVAAQGMVNGLGNVVKSLFSAYGASKGAPISPVKGTSQLDIARMDELWNQQMNQEQRANAEQLQLMLQDYQYNRGNEEWMNRWKMQSDESDKDRQAQWKQNELTRQENSKDRMLYLETQRQLSKDQALELEKLKSQNKSQFWDETLPDKENLARLAGAIRSGQIDQQGNIQSGLIDQRGDKQKEVNAEKPSSKQAYFTPKDSKGQDYNLNEGDFLTTVDLLQNIQDKNQEPILDKKGKPTGQYKTLDERYKGLENADLTTTDGRKTAVNKYFKYLHGDNLKAQQTSSTQAAPLITPPSTTTTQSKQDNRLIQLQNDPAFKALTKEQQQALLQKAQISYR